MMHAACLALAGPVPKAIENHGRPATAGKTSTSLNPLVGETHELAAAVAGVYT